MKTKILIPKGWSIVPQGQKLKKGDRYCDLDGGSTNIQRWVETVFPGTKSDSDYIRKNPRKRIKKTPIQPDSFAGWSEPIGATVVIYPLDSVRARMAERFFCKELFKYFEELSSGQTGWGINFIVWLGWRGWKLIDFQTFERVQAMEEI